MLGCVPLQWHLSDNAPSFGSERPCHSCASPFIHYNSNPTNMHATRLLLFALYLNGLLWNAVHAAGEGDVKLIIVCLCSHCCHNNALTGNLRSPSLRLLSRLILMLAHIRSPCCVSFVRSCHRLLELLRVLQLFLTLFSSSSLFLSFFCSEPR